jgi:7-cyano-7-deazaguanine synthase
MTGAQPRAIILLSGGLDSATCLAIAKDQGYECCAITFDYGQRHRQELDAAKALGKSMGVKEHVVVSFDLRQWGGSALTADMPVPKDGRDLGRPSVIPTTYVPARNTIFLSFAMGWAETLAASHIYLGVNAIDYSGYPDCRPEFIHAFERLAMVATKAGVEGHPLRIVAPLVSLTKAEIIQIGTRLGVDYALTLSCYDPDERGYACGLCDACRLRHTGFMQARIPDPTRYARIPARA